MADQMTTTRTGGPMATDTSDIDAELRDTLARAKELMVQKGFADDHADALLQSAMPDDHSHVTGNLADLQRLGGQLAPQSGGMADAFVKPPELPDQITLNQMTTGRADGHQTDGPVTEAMQAARDAAGGSTDATEASGGDREALEQMTKAELFEEAAERGVDVPSSATKAEIIDALEA